MLEELIGALLRTQSGSLKRKATGAAVEIAALGLFGLAIVFILIGSFLWLSGKMEMWAAALIVAAIVSVVALALMVIGRTIMRQNSRRDREQLDRVLGEFAPLAYSLMGDNKGAHPSGAGLMAVALATGIALGRFLRR
jgi:hypothetical protein